MERLLSHEDETVRALAETIVELQVALQAYREEREADVPDNTWDYDKWVEALTRAEARIQVILEKEKAPSP